MDVANLCVTPQTQKNVCCKILLKISLLWALKLLEVNDKYLVTVYFLHSQTQTFKIFESTSNLCLKINNMKL